MFRSRFFRRLYLTYTLLVVVTATMIGVLVQRRAERDLVAEIGTRLHAVAGALHPIGVRAFVEPEYPAEPVVNEIGARSGTRVTLIAPDGSVLADSEHDPATMDNHAGRPEVVAAMRDGEGTSTRHSTTVRYRMMYYAVRLQQDGRALGVVRVSIPLATVDRQLVELRTQIAQGALLAVLLALVLGALVARRLTSPIAELTTVSEALRAGDYAPRFRGTGRDELHVLGETLNLLAGELSERVSSLTRQRAQLDTIIRSMQEGVVAVDERRRVVASNRVGRDLLGLPEGADSRLDQAASSLPGLQELLAELDAGAEAASREVTIESGEAETVLDVRGARFEADGDRGVVLVLYNITGLRRLERVRTDFVANVSHELKTPLTSIQGYVETLLDGAVDDPANKHRFLEKIRGHVRRLSALVSDLLSLAKIESPALSLRLRPVDWHEIVTDSLARRRDGIAAKRLALRVEPCDVPVRVEGEPESMRQIIDNLLDNAINYTPEGGAIHVRVGCDGALGVVTIADTGIGIPENALDRVFERFYRVDRGRSRAVGGTGLGLSIVRNLVSRMKGRVSVESEVGAGSTFRVELPLAPS